MSEGAGATIVITGGTGGIGYQSALGLAQSGARVVITGRNEERGQRAREAIVAQTGNAQIELVLGDLSSRAGVQELAERLLSRHEVIDVLINNAGYLGSEFAETADGLERHFGINVAAPYWLTQALLPALERGAPSRVLNITGGKPQEAVEVDNLQAEQGFLGLETYSHSKSAMEAMSMAMAEQLRPRDIFVHVLYPGAAATAMTQGVTMATLPWFMKPMYPFFKLFMREDGGKSAAKAARSSIWGAFAPELLESAGLYADSKCRLEKLHPSVYEPSNQRAVLALIESTVTQKQAEGPDEMSASA